MRRHLLFGRREYAEPLELVGEVEADDTPTLETAGMGADWLELVALPENEAIWVVRDASLAARPEQVPS